ncbi:DoxX family protein [Nocardia jejuensis]|uniref:DoxX family protein n=1 Tax=Nocardia jejuensis TaxID=328049 RepID=UPI000835D0E1|nr:DoxX family membrane protein [Nocardia jejuensis]
MVINGKSTSRVRLAAQAFLGVMLVSAGTSHLTFAREDFRAQVPSWFPLDTDFVVLASGVVEITLGSALLLTWKQPRRALVGAIVAAFFVVIFPGNIAQLVEHRDAFGLDSDAKRAVRLVFQPALVAWALLATDAVGVWRDRRALTNS